MPHLGDFVSFIETYMKYNLEGTTQNKEAEGVLSALIKETFFYLRVILSHTEFSAASSKIKLGAAFTRALQKVEAIGAFQEASKVYKSLFDSFCETFMPEDKFEIEFLVTDLPKLEHNSKTQRFLKYMDVKVKNKRLQIVKSKSDSSDEFEIEPRLIQEAENILPTFHLI
jgi:hypothetical protein